MSRTCEREAVDSDSIEEVHFRLKSIVLSYNNVPFLDFLGAFGYFEVTHDITKYCKADVFSEIGKKTRVCVRFSTLGERERGREGGREREREREMKGGRKGWRGGEGRSEGGRERGMEKR